MLRDLLSAFRAAAWMRIFEPLLRRWPGYPPDWERRRMAVFERALGRCEECGLPAGRIGLREEGWRVTGAHVHHVTPIAAGGLHGLRNLRLLCAACHAAAHPGNPRLAAILTPPRSPSANARSPSPDRRARR